MKTVYHGSSNLFEKFSFEFIGQHGTSEGIGFYFTSSPAIAKGYATEKGKGYLYTVNFTGKKSLSFTRKTITRSQVRRFMLALPRYLQNWYTVDEALDVEYGSNDNDVDLICSILHATGEYEKSLKKLQNLLGYDSIVIEQPEWGEHIIYVALTHSAYEIESISEVYPSE